MKLTLAAGLLAFALCLTSAVPGRAQSPTPPTPTTRILAIGTVNPGADVAAARAILPMEVRETVKLYLDGKIDQWYSLQNRVGVAFILNVTDIAAAHDMLEKLPLGQARSHELRADPAWPAQSASAVAGHVDGSTVDSRYARRRRRCGRRRQISSAQAMTRPSAARRPTRSPAASAAPADNTDTGRGGAD